MPLTLCFLLPTPLAPRVRRDTRGGRGRPREGGCTELGNSGGGDGEGKLEGISETRVKNRKMGVGQKEGGLVVVGD